MIETPSIGVIPIASILNQVDHIETEISHVMGPPILERFEIGLIYTEIKAMAFEIGHIQGETHETITYGKDGSVTMSETGVGEAMSLSIGFSPASAHAEASSAGPVASAHAATAAAGIGNLADAVAVAIGQQATAITSVA
jgi:hypothetical protein